jgi:nucleoside-diphosphate-sugar epimerase
MKILITGNMGYVGSALTRHLRATFEDAELIGYDSAFFAHCLSTPDILPEVRLNRQYFGDVRELDDSLLADVDAVVHLAAVSNDPMGNRFEAPTEEINFGSSVDLAERALAAGVKNFVFASSCSIYGFTEGGLRTESDQLTPLTAYARSKVRTEQALAKMKSGDMVITCLRFATACGMSDRLRLDLVLNDFVACALALGEITVLSDGSPWRPLIDVSDMARAIEWAITRPAGNGGRYIAVNAGSSEWNFQVKDIAEAVCAAIPGTTISIKQDALPDKRSYRVDFSLYRSLAPSHQPRMTLQDSVRKVRDGLEKIGFADTDFRSSRLIRLQVLDEHIRSGRLSPRLFWTGESGLRKGGKQAKPHGRPFSPEIQVGGPGLT